MLAALREVWIARGRALDRRPAKEVKAKDFLGPTGKIRAPMVRRGDILLVGLHRASLAELLGN